MNLDQVKKLMNERISYLETELMKIQTWKASTWLIEWINIFVESWGMDQKLNQLSNVTIIDSQTIKVEPWDKSTISSIEKWIVNSGTWLSPLNQWDYILIKIPTLTKERRIELTKLINKIWEEYKIQTRNIRHDAINSNKTLLQNKEISEDENKRFESNLDKTTKDFNKKIEERIKARSEDIMKL